MPVLGYSPVESECFDALLFGFGFLNDRISDVVKSDDGSPFQSSE